MSYYATDDFPTMRELRALDPTVYEHAAALVEAGIRNFSCLAIGAAEGNDHRHEDAYSRVFAPWTGYDYGMGWEKHPFWNKRATASTRQYRINALLTMAAMVRDAKAKKKR